MDAQADLSLRWAHMPFCWFCHEAAQCETVGDKTKVMTKNTNGFQRDNKLLKEQRLDSVENITFLGSIISKE